MFVANGKNKIKNPLNYVIRNITRVHVNLLMQNFKAIETYQNHCKEIYNLSIPIIFYHPGNISLEKEESLTFLDLFF